MLPGALTRNTVRAYNFRFRILSFILSVEIHCEYCSSVCFDVYSEIVDVIKNHLTCGARASALQHAGHCFDQFSKEDEIQPSMTFLASLAGVR